MIGRFEELLHDLGKIFHLSLHTDHSNACSIHVRNLTFQLQLDVSQENLWLFSKLIEIPPGKFREEVLREALKANARTDPIAGSFGYLASSNHLALFQKYPLEILNADRLAGLIGGFLDLAQHWQEAISQGRPAPPKHK
jgi:hypothetical protein